MQRMYLHYMNGNCCMYLHYMNGDCCIFSTEGQCKVVTAAMVPTTHVLPLKPANTYLLWFMLGAGLMLYGDCIVITATRRLKHGQ